jgi:hypothetical protein
LYTQEFNSLYITGGPGVVAVLATPVFMLLSGAATGAPRRSVFGNTIVSDARPQVRVTVPKNAIYVGTDHWSLYGITDCQLFVFVESDLSRRVQRLYWVQFEAYLASVPKLSHQYQSQRRAQLGNKDFIVDYWIGTSAKAPSPDYPALERMLVSYGYPPPADLRSGSDVQHAFALLAARGYLLPTPRASIRLVHLVDAKKRGELIIIFSEGIPAGRQIDKQLSEALLSDTITHLKVTFP